MLLLFSIIAASLLPTTSAFHTVQLASIDYLYTIAVPIGGQPFHLAIETGNSMTWVLSSLCDTDIESCSKHPRRYNSTLGERDGRPFFANHDRGHVTGFLSRDFTECMVLFKTLVELPIESMRWSRLEEIEFGTCF